MEMITTALGTWKENEPLIRGDENWPILGHLLNEKILREILTECIGLKRRWNCLEKAIICQNYFKGNVEFGSMWIWDHNMEGNFGFLFNPPLEFHAWFRTWDNFIIDIALPGVIEQGLETKDEIGFCIENRPPVILAGTAPLWLTYETKKVLRREK